MDWRQLREKQFQGKPIGYRVTYHYVGLELDGGSVRVNYSTNRTTLTNLTVYTMYVIKVSAVSSGGIGPAYIVETRTGAEGMISVIKKYEPLSMKTERLPSCYCANFLFSPVGYGKKSNEIEAFDTTCSSNYFDLLWLES